MNELHTSGSSGGCTRLHTSGSSGDTKAAVQVFQTRLNRQPTQKEVGRLLEFLETAFSEPAPVQAETLDF